MTEVLHIHPARLARLHCAKSALSRVHDYCRVVDCRQGASLQGLRQKQMKTADGDGIDEELNRQVGERLNTGKQPATPPILELRVGFAFMHDGEIRKALVTTQLPGERHLHTDEKQNAFDWAAYALLEPANKHRFTPEWLDEQIEFMRGMSDADIHTLLNYMAGGDMLVNCHTLYQAALVPTDSPFGARMPKAHWYLQHVWGGNEHLLFEGQLRRTLGIEGSKQKLAHELASLDKEKMDMVLDTFIEDMRLLFQRAPVLRQPMTVYRGEAALHEHIPYKNLPLARVSTSRFLSCSLDASSACKFARDHTVERGLKSVGTLYRITLPVGTPVIFSAGMQTWRGVFECECIVPPVCIMQQLSSHTMDVQGAPPLTIVDTVAHLTTNTAHWRASRENE